MELVRSWATTWRHIGVNHAGLSGTIGGLDANCRVSTESRQSRRYDSVTPIRPIGVTDPNLNRCAAYFLSSSSFLSLSLFFLSLFSLLSAHTGDRCRLRLSCCRRPPSELCSPPTPVFGLPEGSTSLLTE
jgi:hypothetical protein